MSEADQIRTEIQALRQDVTAALTTGLAAVNTTMNALAEQHHQAVLEQTKLNATFASRDAVQGLQEQVKANIGRMDRMQGYHDELKSQLAGIGTQLAGVSGQVSQATDHQLNADQYEWVKHGQSRSKGLEDTRNHVVRQALGYLVVAALGMLLAAAGISHVLSHIGGH